LDPKLHRAVDGRYGRIVFLANDIGAIGQSLALYGEWAENELNFVRQFIQPGATVLDVGAYVGTHTLAFARFVGSEGRVVAFEPMPATFEVLKENVLANNLVNVCLKRAAAGDRTGFIEIPETDVAGEASFGSTSLKGRHIDEQENPEETAFLQTKAAKVPVITIDDLRLASCSFIKIDAEGMESAVIRGAANTIRLHTPTIYAECNSVADGWKTVEQLQALGYEVRLHIVDAFAPDNFFGVQQNIFGQAREAALVGVPSHQKERLDALTIRPCELLVRIETADDLVLGLLNKPQYAAEILAPSTAAGSGADAWLNEMTSLRLEKDRLENEMAWAKEAIAEERTLREQTAQTLAHQLHAMQNQLENEAARAKEAIAEERTLRERTAQTLARELQAMREQFADVERKLNLYRTEADNKTALFEAAMRQAQFARDLADAASRSAERAKREKEQALAMRAELVGRIEEMIGRQLEYEKQLHAIYTSTSWRLTAPARKIMGWLRRRFVAG
jgi:FkbM family methyltransferase